MSIFALALKAEDGYSLVKLTTLYISQFPLEPGRVVSSSKVDTEKWDTVFQPISSRGETVKIYLDEADTIANLEAVAQAGTGRRRPRVRVDVAGAEFFSMEEVASEFEAEKSSGSAVSSRTQLGYKTTEEVRLMFYESGLDCACFFGVESKVHVADKVVSDHFGRRSRNCHVYCASHACATYPQVSCCPTRLAGFPTHFRLDHPEWFKHLKASSPRPPLLVFRGTQHARSSSTSCH